jgi:hypothetical protein
MDAATAPSAETMAADEPSLQEVAPVVKSSKAPVKKVTSTRGFKRARKSTDAGTSLDAHRSTSSSEDVRDAPDMFPLFLSCELPTHVFSCIEFDDEVCHFGH